MDGLDSKCIGGTERGGDVAEVREAFDDETDGVAPSDNGLPHPLLPSVLNVRVQRLDNLPAPQSHRSHSKDVKIREPTIRFRKPPAIHLHESLDAVGVGEQLLDGVTGVISGNSSSGGKGGELSPIEA